jgi:hypothetical protein
MKPSFACLLAVALGNVLLCAAQDPANPPKPGSRAAIEGIVTKDPSGEPVKKAVIELIAANQAAGGDYTAVSGPDGRFRIEGILPGRYHLFAERTGYLETERHQSRSEGRILALSAGQELKDVLIRLQAAAVVRGQVTDEDGDPLANAQVSVLRRTFVSGRGRWVQAGAERTNDLGEYRIAGLAAGSYFVSVNPPPDFKSLIDNTPAGDKSGPSGKPVMAYQTTYYPGTSDRGQAAPIQLHAGDEFPVNFSLTPSPTLSIRGSVVNLPPRSSAAIMLQSLDFNVVLSGAEIHKDGTFVIRDVSPGAYTIVASVENAPVPMMARQSLQVLGNNVEGLRLAPQPGASINGRLRLEGKGITGRFDPTQIFLSLRPTDGDDDLWGAFGMGDGFSNLAHVSADGTFQWKNVPPGSYYIQLTGDNNLAANWFLKSWIVGSRDATDSPITVNGGALSLDLIASANGGIIDGIVADQNGAAVENAVVVAVPAAPLRSRPDRFYKTLADQRGAFSLRCIAPGEYSLFAWESLEGDAYYNPLFLRNYEGQSTSLRVAEGDRKSLQLHAIPIPDDQP